MDLFEYQARDLFDNHDVPVLRAIVVDEPAQAAAAAKQLAKFPVVVKAQVKTGGRGKAGGVKLADSAEQAQAWARQLLGMDIKGHKVRQLMVTQGVEVAEEYYFSILLDRPNHRHLALCSKQGGVNIEELSKADPEAIVKFPLDPDKGITPEVAHQILEASGFPSADTASLVPVLQALWQVYSSEDATLVEVNPLAKLADGTMVALDAKVSLDDNARFRHPNHAAYRSEEVEDPMERAAAESNLNYVRLDGQVGIIGNGAGLVMATLDAVSMAGSKYGVSPANFLDIGGGAGAKVMRQSLALVLSDPNVRSVLINVFGGITSCQLVAEGIDAAIRDLPDGLAAPVVVRLDGNRAAEGKRALEQAGHRGVRVAATMDEAAELAAQLAATLD